METWAVVIEAPLDASLRRVELKPLAADEVLIETLWSGVSAGTERLLWSGRMPPFPGLGYPLVPGYETVGRVIDAGSEARGRIGETVFVPGSVGFVEVKGLFGGAAQRLVSASSRVATLDPAWGETGVLLALAATAWHALAGGPGPELVVGHGVLGRLLSRLALVRDGVAPTVWEIRPERRLGAKGYAVVDPATDDRHDYRVICEASGAGAALGGLIERLGRGGEIVLAGFYDAALSFDFAPAFMREARLRVAAEWTHTDLAAVVALLSEGRLDLSDLITHRRRPDEAATAYAQAFDDPACLKMVFDWRGLDDAHGLPQAGNV